MIPLAGVTVLDISRLLPGGYASLLLSELGARVIKIEQPGVGDYYRALFKGEGILGAKQVQVINRGKESLGLDLRFPEGKELFKKLVRRADVVIENFRPGVLKKLGLDYRVLRTINPRIILCSITGFGQRGESSHLAGHDLNYLGLSGFLARITDEQGRFVIPDFQIIDLAAGSEAAMRISASLHQRARTKKGCRIDCSMLNTGLSMSRLYSSNEKGRRSIVAGGLVRYGVYETSDGRFVTLAALEPKFWRRFCEVMDRPAWADRAESFEFLGEEKREELKGIFQSKSLAEWLAIGTREDLCIFPVQSLEDLPRTPQRKTPRLGEQTPKILKFLGLRPKQIRDLRKKGVVE